MLTRITNEKILCEYIHVHQIKKNWGPGPCNSLCHADNREHFLGLSLMRNRREMHVLLGEGSGKIWKCSCSEKGYFIIVNEFKYGLKFGHRNLVYLFKITLTSIPYISFKQNQFVLDFFSFRFTLFTASIFMCTFIFQQF